MTDKRKKRASWQRFVSMPRSFSYEIDAPIEEVMRRLAETEQESRFMQRASQDVSVLPMQDHYVFRVRRRSFGTITASAEGQVYQDDTGCVIVDGETQVNGWGWIVPLVLMSLFGIGLSIVSMPAASRYILLIPFFITMILGFGSSFVTYQRDRQHLVKQLDEAISSLQHPSRSKPKREARLALEDSQQAVALDAPHEEDAQRHHNGQ